jgi:choice-of-anchor B domain-containing protein
MPLSRLRVALTAGILVWSLAPAVAQPYACEGGVVVHAAETYRCSNVDLLSRVTLQQMDAFSGNDSWGWTDPQSGREYALMGLDNGTFFVDITEPGVPRLLGKLPTESISTLWRDMKVHADHMFVVSEAANHGMQIFDLTRLRGLEEDRHRTFVADAVFTGGDGPAFFRAHNVAINEETGRAYIVGARDHEHLVCQGGLYIVDVSQPKAPQFAGCFADDGYIHDVQCVIYSGPDSRYAGRELCFASSPASSGLSIGNPNNTLTIIDVTDSQQSVEVGKTSYGIAVGSGMVQASFAHQGWLTGDQRHFFLNDEGDQLSFGLNTRSIVIDVSDIEQPFFVDSYFYSTQSIAHNLFIRNRYLFAANYTTGLQVLDVGDLETSGRVDDISRIGYFDTFPDDDHPRPRDLRHDDAQTFQGAWSNYPFFESGVVLVSDINRGLFVLQPTNLDVAAEPGPEHRLAIMEIFPSPFRDRLSVGLLLDRDQRVRIEAFDILGRRVASLFDDRLSAGQRHEMTFTLSHLPAGFYVVRAVGEDFVLSQQVSRLH